VLPEETLVRIARRPDHRRSVEAAADFREVDTRILDRLDRPEPKAEN
jgi:hypothetical protein